MRIERSPASADTAVHPSRRRGVDWRPGLVGLVLGVLATLVVGAVVVAPWVLAKHQDLPLERVYGDFAVSIASRLGAGNAQNPVAQNGRALVAGRDAYTGSCAVCHGANGDGRGVFGTSSYPNATDLRSHDAAEKSDAQLFWIVKNGLSFTGMPSFGEQYNDQDIWSLVTYIRALQDPSRANPSGSGNNGGPPGQSPAGNQPDAGGSGRQAGRTFQLAAINVPTPTADQIGLANPSSADAVARGAAIYFAQGCQTCHAAAGDAPGNLGLRRGGSPEEARTIRQGRPGMPAYSQAQVSEAELADLQAYLATIGTSRGGEGGGAGEGDAPTR